MIFKLKVMINCDNKLKNRVFGMGLSISILNNSLKTSLGYSDQAVVSRVCGGDALTPERDLLGCAGFPSLTW